MKNDKISFVCTDSFDYLLIHLNKMIQKKFNILLAYSTLHINEKKKKERKKPRDIVNM